MDELEQSLQAAQTGWDESSADVQRLTNDLRAKTRDLETMKVPKCSYSRERALWPRDSALTFPLGPAQLPTKRLF